MVALVGSAIVDLHSRPPWSNNAVRRLGVALRDGVDPPVDCPSYAEVMLWHADLAAEVQDRIEGRSWSASELLVTSRAKSQDTLLAKLRRRPYLQLNTIQDIAGVRIDADLLLGEQTRLAREIADPGQRAMALGEASKNKATVLATTKFRLERAINEAESAGGGG